MRIDKHPKQPQFPKHPSSKPTEHALQNLINHAYQQPQHIMKSARSIKAWAKTWKVTTTTAKRRLTTLKNAGLLQTYLFTYLTPNQQPETAYLYQLRQNKKNTIRKYSLAATAYLLSPPKTHITLPKTNPNFPKLTPNSHHPNKKRNHHKTKTLWRFDTETQR